MKCYVCGKPCVSRTDGPNRTLAAGVCDACLPAPGDTCVHGHTERKIGCVSCVLLFDFASGDTAEGAPRGAEQSHVGQLRTLYTSLASPAQAEPPDEEMVPHEFNARIPGEEDNDGHIWCADCEYHRDHEIHTTKVAEPPEALKARAAQWLTVEQQFDLSQRRPNSEALVRDLLTHIEKLEAEHAALREALVRYGRHTRDCDVGTCAVDGVEHLGRMCHELPKKACTCGFDAALARTEASPEPELCGVKSGWGDPRDYGCLLPAGHTVRHRNRMGYEWVEASQTRQQEDR